MKSRKRKWIAVFCSMIVLLISIITGLTVYFSRNQDEITIENSQYPREGDTLFDATGKGNVAPEDCYLIQDRETGIAPHVFPGDSYVGIKRSEKLVIMTNEIDGESYTRARREYEYLDAVFYDLGTGKETRKIDMLDIMKEACPGFQESGAPSIVLGEDGHKYIGLELANIPEKADDEVINKMLVYDIETGDTFTKDSEEEWREFLRAGYEKKDKEYGMAMEEVDWEWDKLLKKEEEEYITPGVHVVVLEARGCVEVRIDCSLLPEKNDILYNRFPNLKEYNELEGKVACIYIGGYPTADEIKAMFCENADSGGELETLQTD